LPPPPVLEKAQFTLVPSANIRKDGKKSERNFFAKAMVEKRANPKPRDKPTNETSLATTKEERK